MFLSLFARLASMALVSRASLLKLLYLHLIFSLNVLRLRNVLVIVLVSNLVA